VSGIQIDPMNPLSLYTSSIDHTVKFWDMRKFKRPSRQEEKSQLTITTSSIGHEIKPLVVIKNMKR
jgi:hypothetical protein